MLKSVADVVDYCKANGFFLFTRGTKVVSVQENEKASRLLTMSNTLSPSTIPNGQLEEKGWIKGDKKSIDPLIATSLIEDLNRAMADSESDLRRVSSLPITKAFMYFDISDFSMHKDGEQALIIASLSSLSQGGKSMKALGNNVAESRDALCIGDGYIFVFDSGLDACIFACIMANNIEKKCANKELPVEYHFRIGIHIGEVFTFWDWGKRNWNYIGSGINGGQRVLASIGKDLDDVIYISSAIREELIRESGTERNKRIASHVLLHTSNIGRRKDKHGKSWRVFSLNHVSMIADAKTKL